MAAPVPASTPGAPPQLQQTISGTSAANGSQVVAGTVYGNVQFGTIPPKGEASPKPLSTTPFRRDSDFVDRDDILLKVEQLCSQPGGRAALVGLGGVGKSQLAIEYTYRVRARFPDTWVFWVHASNAARFEQGYREIADVAKVSSTHNSNIDIFQYVYNWLRASSAKWLIVLDNVDDAAFLVDTPESSHEGISHRPLREYLPQSPNGSILVTTRNREAALKLSEPRDLIPVSPMTEPHAIALLEKKLSNAGGDAKDAAALVKALEFMPLAITQAAAYISRLAPRYSVRQYVEEFERSDRKRSSLLNYEGEQLRRDGEAKNSVIITWQISFEHIRKARQSAADLLSLMSFFDSQGIPEKLVRRGRSNAKQVDEGYAGGQEDENSDSASSEDDAFEADVQLLRDFSFIALGASPDVFEMHKLVQLATRKWLEANKQIDLWTQRHLEHLDDEVPNPDYDKWSLCATYFPHVRLVSAKRPRQELSLLLWASILYKGGWYASQIQDGATALEMSEKSLKAREETLGRKHRETLRSRALLGLTYELVGRWREAEQLEMQTLEMSTETLGSADITTLASMTNLAIMYQGQGRLDEAEQLLSKSVATSKKVHGDDVRLATTSMEHLAMIYMNQGRLKEAEELIRETIAVNKRVKGPDHLQTLVAIMDLAAILGKRGRWEEAEKLHMQSVEGYKRILGPNHPETMTSMNNAAATFIEQQRWKEAIELLQPVVDTSISMLGEDHPETLISMDNLANALKEGGQEQRGVQMKEECVQRRMRVLGPDHPATKRSKQGLDGWLENLKSKSTNTNGG